MEYILGAPFVTRCLEPAGASRVTTTSATVGAVGGGGASPSWPPAVECRYRGPLTHHSLHNNNNSSNTTVGVGAGQGTSSDDATAAAASASQTAALDESGEAGAAAGTAAGSRDTISTTATTTTTTAAPPAGRLSLDTGRAADGDGEGSGDKSTSNSNSNDNMAEPVGTTSPLSNDPSQQQQHPSCDKTSSSTTMAPAAAAAASAAAAAAEAPLPLPPANFSRSDTATPSLSVSRQQQQQLRRLSLLPMGYCSSPHSGGGGGGLLDAAAAATLTPTRELLGKYVLVFMPPPRSAADWAASEGAYSRQHSSACQPSPPHHHGSSNPYLSHSGASAGTSATTSPLSRKGAGALDGARAFSRSAAAHRGSPDVSVTSGPLQYAAAPATPGPSAAAADAVDHSTAWRYPATPEQQRLLAFYCLLLEQLRASHEERLLLLQQQQERESEGEEGEGTEAETGEGGGGGCTTASSSSPSQLRADGGSGARRRRGRAPVRGLPLAVDAPVAVLEVRYAPPVPLPSLFGGDGTACSSHLVGALSSQVSPIPTTTAAGGASAGVGGVAGAAASSSSMARSQSMTATAFASPHLSPKSRYGSISYTSVDEPPLGARTASTMTGATTTNSSPSVPAASVSPAPVGAPDASGATTPRQRQSMSRVLRMLAAGQLGPTPLQDAVVFDDTVTTNPFYGGWMCVESSDAYRRLVHQHEVLHWPAVILFDPAGNMLTSGGLDHIEAELEAYMASVAEHDGDDGDDDGDGRGGHRRGGGGGGRWGRGYTGDNHHAHSCSSSSAFDHTLRTQLAGPSQPSPAAAAVTAAAAVGVAGRPSALLRPDGGDDNATVSPSPSEPRPAGDRAAALLLGRPSYSHSVSLRSPGPSVGGVADDDTTRTAPPVKDSRQHSPPPPPPLPERGGGGGERAPTGVATAVGGSGELSSLQTSARTELRAASSISVNDPHVPTAEPTPVKGERRCGGNAWALDRPATARYRDPAAAAAAAAGGRAPAPDDAVAVSPAESSSTGPAATSATTMASRTAAASATVGTSRRSSGAGAGGDGSGSQGGMPRALPMWSTPPSRQRRGRSGGSSTSPSPTRDGGDGDSVNRRLGCGISESPIPADATATAASSAASPLPRFCSKFPWNILVATATAATGGGGGAAVDDSDLSLAESTEDGARPLPRTHGDGDEARRQKQHERETGEHQRQLSSRGVSSDGADSTAPPVSKPPHAELLLRQSWRGAEGTAAAQASPLAATMPSLKLHPIKSLAAVALPVGDILDGHTRACSELGLSEKSRPSAEEEGGGGSSGDNAEHNEEEEGEEEEEEAWHRQASVRFGPSTTHLVLFFGAGWHPAMSRTTRALRQLAQSINSRNRRYHSRLARKQQQQQQHSEEGGEGGRGNERDGDDAAAAVEDPSRGIDDALNSRFTSLVGGGVAAAAPQGLGTPGGLSGAFFGGAFDDGNNMHTCDDDDGGSDAGEEDDGQRCCVRVVYLSFDETVPALRRTLEAMPSDWLCLTPLALPADLERGRQTVPRQLIVSLARSAYKVDAFPRLVVLELPTASGGLWQIRSSSGDGDGDDTIRAAARAYEGLWRITDDHAESKLSADPTGLRFPWATKEADWRRTSLLLTPEGAGRHRAVVAERKHRHSSSSSRSNNLHGRQLFGVGGDGGPAAGAPSAGNMLIPGRMGSTASLNGSCEAITAGAPAAAAAASPSAFPPVRPFTAADDDLPLLLERGGYFVVLSAMGPVTAADHRRCVAALSEARAWLYAQIERRKEQLWADPLLAVRRPCTAAAAMLLSPTPDGGDGEGFLGVAATASSLSAHGVSGVDTPPESSSSGLRRAQPLSTGAASPFGMVELLPSVGGTSTAAATTAGSDALADSAFSLTHTLATLATTDGALPPLPPDNSSHQHLGLPSVFFYDAVFTDPTGGSGEEEEGGEEEGGAAPRAAAALRNTSDIRDERRADVELLQEYVISPILEQGERQLPLREGEMFLACVRLPHRSSAVLRRKLPSEMPKQPPAPQGPGGAAVASLSPPSAGAVAGPRPLLLPLASGGGGALVSEPTLTSPPSVSATLSPDDTSSSAPLDPASPSGRVPSAAPVTASGPGGFPSVPASSSSDEAGASNQGSLANTQRTDAAADPSRAGQSSAGADTTYTTPVESPEEVKRFLAEHILSLLYV